MAFEQAAIKVQKEQEFARLRAAIERAFSPHRVEHLLNGLDRKGIRIRDFDAVLAQGGLGGPEKAGPEEVKVQQLYQALPLSDQAQIREFYLSKLEAVDVVLRHKFKKLYQYY